MMFNMMLKLKYFMMKFMLRSKIELIITLFSKFLTKQKSYVSRGSLKLQLYEYQHYNQNLFKIQRFT